MPEDPQETKNKLGGEADPNSWHFVASHGPLPNPVGHTFPLLTHSSEGAWRLIGTGFYISRDGLFVTAGHVIQAVLDHDQQILPLAIMHLHSESGLFGSSEYLMRPVVQCWLGDKSDIALGVAASASNNTTGSVLSPWSWPLAWKTQTIGTRAATYAFPNHSVAQTPDGQLFRFAPDLYVGDIQAVDDFRDQLLVPYPYMNVGFHIHFAASGGPVVSEEGVVIGVNCRFMDPDGPGVVVQIRCLQDAFIDGMLVGETVERQLSFSDLVDAGVVIARQYAANVVPPQPGRLLRLDTVPIVAPRPKLEISMYT